ncbi:3-dehydroquinate synthase, partial [Patescibacteria group bacterium]|nr:3-dehydroquinate synthase [Patescibacteria group bacterium]
VTKDPSDRLGFHKGLSYGHTFANVLEGLSKYSLRHGEAVSLGMRLAGEVSNCLGYLSIYELNRQNALLDKIGLPNKLTKNLSIAEALKLLKHDKISSNGSINLVLLEKIGSFFVENDISDKVINKAFLSIK